ncbi:uncharacterized protein LOC117180376 isoform X2 [Belonocnema kinseyi]|uniref:uncharacterized protein LOC117180376 isoform X2 n=1 Tax=Belonocnema kinseyi TaxID=2817044 RepID=UPI00143DC4EC|nr:uncharacterized protein LOC117180376 isoform X2 [Belonocnema kinseyi]
MIEHYVDLVSSSDNESEPFDLSSAFQSSAAFKSSTTRGRLPSLIIAAGTIEGTLGNTSIESLQSTILGGAFDSKDSFSSLTEALPNSHLPADDNLNKRISTEEESAEFESIPEPQAQDTFVIASTSDNKSLPSDSPNKRHPEDINITSKVIDVYKNFQPIENFVLGLASNADTNFSSKCPGLLPYREPLRTISEESSGWSNTDSKMSSGTSQTDYGRNSQDSNRTDLNNTGIELKSIAKHVRKPEKKLESESSPDWYHSSTSAILNTPKNTLQLDMVSQRRRKKKDYSSKSPLSSVEANKENLNAASKKKIVGFSRKVCQFSALNENIDQSQKKKYPTTPRFRINKDNSKSKDISTPNGSEDCFLEKEYHQNILRSFSSDTLREESTTPEVLKSRKEADLCSKMKKPLQNPDRFAERKPQERAKKYRKRRSKSLENNTNLPSSSGIRPLQVPVRRARGPREGTLNVPLRMELTKSSSEKSLNRTQISTMELRPERPLRSKSQEKISPRKPPWKP